MITNDNDHLMIHYLLLIITNNYDYDFEPSAPFKSIGFSKTCLENNAMLRNMKVALLL